MGAVQVTSRAEWIADTTGCRARRTAPHTLAPGPVEAGTDGAHPRGVVRGLAFGGYGEWRLERCGAPGALGVCRLIARQAPPAVSPVLL